VETDTEHNSTQNTEATVFLTDSFVLVQQRSAPETQLHTLWRGPMRVLSSTKAEYTLLDLTTNKEKKYHVTQMKQFHFDPMRTDPSDVARKDYLEFFIETILIHRGNTKRLSTLEFKVKWLSYNESHNSWEPWANLQEMEILHLYLIQKLDLHLYLIQQPQLSTPHFPAFSHVLRPQSSASNATSTTMHTTLAQC
jgi:Chromo (CHRromatin Organisation MOdifier) domain